MASDKTESRRSQVKSFRIRYSDTSSVECECDEIASLHSPSVPPVRTIDTTTQATTSAQTVSDWHEENETPKHRKMKKQGIPVMGDYEDADRTRFNHLVKNSSVSWHEGKVR